MAWSLYNQEHKELAPLTFSNKKTQEDVVNEVVQKIQEGHKVIFIKGVCGSGKSAIALNIAKEMGKASVVVPVKYLQQQYEQDYTKKFYLRKKDGDQVKITVLTGRNNHACLYNTSCNADDKFLPCHIKISKENVDLIRLYLKENPFVKEDDFKGVEDVKRFSVAAACPYWSPVVGKDWSQTYEFDDAQPYEYKGLRNKRHIYYKRKPGCSYYAQFMSYITSDIIVYNSKKYELENAMDRKPETEVEIIDECDEFLDNLGNEKRINLHHLLHHVEETLTTKERKKEGEDKTKEVLQELKDLILTTMEAKWLKECIDNSEIIKIKDTPFFELIALLIANDFLAEDEELERYIGIAKSFEGMFESTYINFSRTIKAHILIKIVNINLERRFNELLEKNKVFVMMSGTLHSPDVLRNIFGIKDFIFVDAETQLPGIIKKVRTNAERNFRYKEFAAGKVTREDYLRALQKCIELAEKPFLVHVNSFSDLPTEEEKEKYHLGIISRERFYEQQERYKTGELLQRFKNKELEVLYSTKCSRGVDLPGDTCKSIIFTKYPYPSMDSLFWRILKDSSPDKFMEFYFDKAHREFLQRIFRGLRSKDDKVSILSPDSKVLSANIV